MTIINHYSIIHFIIYYLVGRYTGIKWSLFLAFSFGWELLELVLPYDFAIETMPNKVADILVNFIGYGLGLYIKAVSYTHLTLPTKA